MRNRELHRNVCRMCYNEMHPSKLVIDLAGIGRRARTQYQRLRIGAKGFRDGLDGNTVGEKALFRLSSVII